METALKEIPILKRINSEQCCGCEACVSVCPTKVLEMKMGKEGFYYPTTVPTNKCIDCKQCVKSCPLLNSKNRKTIDVYYAGYSKDEGLVLNSSSGGIFSELIYALSDKFHQDYAFVGVVWNTTFTGTEYMIGSCESDLARIRRSKYIQARKKSVYLDTKKLLAEGHNVVFCGCPCEVAALYNVLGKEFDNLYTIDLVCQGPSSPKAMKQYVERIEKKARGRVTALNMRYVHSQEWIPKWIDIHFDNRKRILKFFDETDIGRCLHIMQRKSCYSCNFIGSNHKADITIGDYHGAIKGETYYNRMGTSIVIVNTEKGRKMLDCLVNRGNTVMIEGDKDYIKSHNPRICSTWEESSARKDFVINFEEHGLHVAAQKSWSIRERILHRMPLSYRNMKKKVKQFLIGEQTR